MGCQQIKEKRKEPIKNQSKSTKNQPSDINQNSMKEQNVPPSPKDTPNKLEDNPQINQKEITLQEQSYPQTDMNNPINQSESPVLFTKNENKNVNQIDDKEGKLLENKIISDNINKILDFCNEEYIPGCIGKLCFDPIILFIYNSKKNSFNAQKFEYTLIDFEELNNTSTYCNGDNKLFVSGGIDKNGKALDKLWIFDLLDYNVEGPIQMNGKYNHSMIFIPKKYIFFVGGNDENVFYYDLKEKKIENWDRLNKKRIEPALIVMNNYLYVFDNVNKIGENNNFELSFERTNLLSAEPKWEIVVPELSRNILENNNIIPKYFGASKESKESIIFLGGNIMDEDDNINEGKSYRYNIKENLIEITDIPFINISLKEKNFFPFNEKSDIYLILPDFYKNCPQVVFYIKNKNAVKVINYKPNSKNEEKKINDLGNNINDIKEKIQFKNYNFNMPKIPEKINEIVEI